MVLASEYVLLGICTAQMLWGNHRISVLQETFYGWSRRRFLLAKLQCSFTILQAGWANKETIGKTWLATTSAI